MVFYHVIYICFKFQLGNCLAFYFFHQPIPPGHLAKAQKYFCMYVQYCMKLFGEQWATPKNHWLIHILDDCKNFGCHLERMSAWAFENEYSSVRNNLRNGNHTLQQLKYVFN